MQPHLTSPSSKQAGFTLIELMVVVVIVSVVTSISILSLGPSEQAKLTTQQNQLKTLLGFVRDQSTFDRKLYLVTPDDKGLTTHVFTKNKWQKADKVAFLAWQAGINASWKVDEDYAQQQQLPDPGWLFWPTGEVLEGEAYFSVGENAFQNSNKAEVSTVVWDGLLQFESSTQTK